MIFHVVTEGRSDALLLKKLLEVESERAGGNIRFGPAGGWSAADSMARSLLIMRRREPVVLAVDADVVGELAREREAFLRSSLGAVARPEMFEVVVFEPSIEALLFCDARIVEHIAGRRPTEVETARAEYAPKRVLGEMGNELLMNAPSRLGPEDIERLRATPQIMRIRKFLNDWLDKSAPAKMAV